MTKGATSATSMSYSTSNVLKSLDNSINTKAIKYNMTIADSGHVASQPPQRPQKHVGIF